MLCMRGFIPSDYTCLQVARHSEKSLRKRKVKRVSDFPTRFPGHNNVATGIRIATLIENEIPLSLMTAVLVQYPVLVLVRSSAPPNPKSAVTAKSDLPGA